MHAFSKSKRLHVHFSGIGICAIVQLPRHHLGPIRLHLVVVGNGEPVLQTQSKIFSPRNIVVLGNARCPRVDARALVWRQTRTALRSPPVRACAGRRLPFILFSFHFVFVLFCLPFICFSLHFVFVSFVFRFILFSFLFVFVSFCFRFIFVYRMFSLLCFPVLNFFFQLFYRPTGPHGGRDARGELRQI